MKVQEIVNDKSIKHKAKTELISDLVLKQELSAEELLKIAAKLDDATKATCIEALEYLTKKHPEFVTEKCLKHLVKFLSESAPRVKWEAARVIANTAKNYIPKLNTIVPSLLVNTEHPGTVVRWATAMALAEIVKLKTPLNKDLVPAIETILLREEDGGVKKKYVEALKKIKK